MLTATYSVEDNKLRIYPDGTRVDSLLTAGEYEDFKRAGYKWAGKQECFVCPRWTPQAEDWAYELAEEIGDEDYSATERSADRAERFGGYRDKRAAEAGESADAFDSGPSAFGHQNRHRAERQAIRHDRHRGRACSQWSKAEYWQQRTAGVIGHALYKARPEVRRSRIKRLEAEQRKHEKESEDYARRYYSWKKVLELDGADAPLVKATPPLYGINQAASSKAGVLAYTLANHNSWGEYQHPRRPDRKTSLYSLLTDEADPITPREAAELWLAKAIDPETPDTWRKRWADHYARRLEYERAMLANEGGTAADAEMEPGGWIGKNQIYAVNRSTVTGKVVSVKLWAPKPWYNGPDPVPLTLQSFNIERLPEGAYRPPIDEERAEFKTKKKTEPKAPPIVNPTDEDAERLQAIWNGQKPKVAAVERMTQAEYSSYGSNSGVVRTVEINADGLRHGDKPAVCRVRIRYRFVGPDSVVILTDKPQARLPFAVAQPTTDEQAVPELAVSEAGELTLFA